MTIEKRDPSNPRRDKRVQVAHEKISSGDVLHVLHNPEAETYLEIDEKNFFLWGLMDGERTLADIAFEYKEEYAAFPFERLDELIKQLKENHLLSGEADDPEGSVQQENRGLLSRLAQNGLRWELDWKGADAFFQALYRRGGRFFFSRSMLIISSLVALTGFVCFLDLAHNGTFKLFSHGGKHGTGLAGLFIANLFMVLCHESGHALTCKKYGRRIRRAGLMFYLGVPAFFVDTTDMWMEKRPARIAVSLAGPIVNVVLAGLFSIVIVVLPVSTVTLALFQAAFLGYLSALLNLNPFLILDGYYVLMDLLEIPQLRQRAFSFIRVEMPKIIKSHRMIDREGIILLLYGVLGIACSITIVLLSLYMWETEVRSMLHDILGGSDVLAAVLLGGLTLAAGTTLVLGLGARAILLIDAQVKRMGLSNSGPSG